MAANMKILRYGFTLIEMMLVLVIISSILAMIASYTIINTNQTVLNRAALQMQQILNAGLAYYVNNGAWPYYSQTTGICTTTNVNGSVLQPAYLPTLNNPFVGHTGYQIGCTSGGQLFTVTLATPSAINARLLAGMLPLAWTSTSTVTAEVNIPGQNLNNARSVNQAGIYHNGACVPVPACPGPTSGATAMVPQIYVAAAQIMGTNDSSSNNPNVYPITGFTAYALGGSNATPPPCPSPSLTDSNCYSNGGTSGTGTVITGQAFWRVCVDIETSAGDIASNASGTGGTGSNSWGQYQSLLAETRCVPASSTAATEGSPLNVWQP